MTAITFEELLNQTNGFGRYQLLVMLVTALPWGVVCFNHMGIIFLADTPNFWCSENLLRNRTLFSTNVTREVHNISGIRTRPGIKDDQCKVRVPNITGIDRSPADDFRQSHEACTRWVYDQTYYDATAVTQWDLVCDAKWMTSIASSVYMTGLLIGVMTTGIISDRFGRRRAVIGTSVATLCFMFALPFSPNFSAFIAFRFFIALFAQGMGSVCYVLAVEWVGARYRLWAWYMNGVPWTLSISLLAGLAYVIKHWQHLALTFAGISTVVLIFVVVYVPESPRWLYAQGKSEEADRIMTKVARINRTTKQLPPHFTVILEAHRKVYTFDLVRSPGIRKRTIIVCYTWFACSMVYYALYLNASSFSTNVYLDIFLAGLLESAVSIILVGVLNKLGRKTPTIVCFLFAATCLFLSTAFTKGHWMLAALSLAGRTATYAAFGVAYVYSAELFPTLLRGNACGAGSMFARFGAMLAPIIGFLGAYHAAIPFVIYGLMALTSGLAIMLLPETKGVKLPDTVEEMEAAASEKPIVTELTSMH